jgi:hypothetical protein
MREPRLSAELHGGIVVRGARCPQSCQQQSLTLLALDGRWQGLDKIRVLMGDETTQRTKKALLEAVKARAERVHP